MRARSMLVLAIAIVPHAVAAAPTASAAKPPVPLSKTPNGAPPPVLASKAPSACGVKVLPLAVGNSWTYTPITAPAAVDAAIARIIPVQAKRVIITVQSIAPKGSDTVVTLEEKVTTEIKDAHDSKKFVDDDHTLTTTITCNAKTFDISPDSFFFAGEPGGSFAVAFDSFDRKGTSWALTAGAFPDGGTWREDIVAHWASTPTPGSHAKLGAGKLELERVFTPQPDDKIGTPVGVFTTDKIGLQTTGRVTLDGEAPDTKLELPDAWINTLWFAKGVGLVQVLNKYAHEYQLSEATLK